MSTGRLYLTDREEPVDVQATPATLAWLALQLGPDLDRLVMVCGACEAEYSPDADDGSDLCPACQAVVALQHLAESEELMTNRRPTGKTS